MKLRGRATTPDERRGRTVSFSARGAQPPAPHGPLQRLLGVGSAKETRMSVLVDQSNELLDCRNFRRWFITVPLEIPTLPENSPPASRPDVGGLGEGLFLLLARSAAPDWPDFEEFHAMPRNAKTEIELRANVRRWPAAFNEATYGFPYSRRFKFAERHREPTPNGEVEGPHRRARSAPRAHNFLRRPRRQTARASRPPPTIVRPHGALGRVSRLPRCK